MKKRKNENTLMSKIIFFSHGSGAVVGLDLLYENPRSHGGAIVPAEGSKTRKLFKFWHKLRGRFADRIPPLGRKQVIPKRKDQSYPMAAPPLRAHGARTEELPARYSRGEPFAACKAFILGYG